MALFEFEKKAVQEIYKSLDSQKIVILLGSGKSGKSTIAQEVKDSNFSNVLLIQGQRDKQFVELFPFKKAKLESQKGKTYKMLSTITNSVIGKLFDSSTDLFSRLAKSTEYATMSDQIERVSQRIIVFDNLEYFDQLSFNLTCTLMSQGQNSSIKKFVFCISLDSWRKVFSHLFKGVQFKKILMPQITSDGIKEILPKKYYKSKDAYKLTVGQLVEIKQLYESNKISSPNIYTFVNDNLLVAKKNLKKYDFILNLLFFYASKTDNSFIDISIIIDYSKWVYHLPDVYSKIKELASMKIIELDDSRDSVRLADVFVQIMENNDISIADYKYNFYDFVNSVNAKIPEEYFQKYLFLTEIKKKNEAIEQGILAYNEFITHGSDPVASSKLKTELLKESSVRKFIQITLNAIDAIVNFEYAYAYHLTDSYLSKQEGIYIGNSAKLIALLTNIKFRAKLRVVTASKDTLALENSDIDDINQVIKLLDDSDDTLLLNLKETKVLLLSQMANSEEKNRNYDPLTAFFEIDKAYANIILKSPVQYQDYWEYRRALFLGKVPSVSDSHSRNIEILCQAKQLLSTSKDNKSFISPAVEVLTNLANEYFEVGQTKNALTEVKKCISLINSTDAQLNWLIVLELQIIFVLLSGNRKQAQALYNKYQKLYFNSVGFEKVHEKFLWQENLILLKVIFEEVKPTSAIKKIDQYLKEFNTDSYDKLFANVNTCLLAMQSNNFSLAETKVRECKTLFKKNIDFLDNTKLDSKLTKMEKLIKSKDKQTLTFDKKYKMYESPLLFSDIAYWSNYI